MAAPPSGPRGPSRLVALLDAFETRVVWGIATALLLVASFIMLMEASARTFVSHSFHWAEEVVRFAVVWAVFLVFGFAARRGHFIRTELLVQRLPPGVRRVLDVVNCLGGLLFAVVLLWAGWVQLGHLRRLGMMSETMELALWVVKAGLIVGAVSLVAYFVYCSVRVLRGEEAYPSGHGDATDD